MDQTRDLIERLEEENRELKRRISRFDAYGLQAGHLKELLRYRKEVAALITGEGAVEDITDGISVYGYSPDEFTSGILSFWDIVHTDDVGKIREHTE